METERVAKSGTKQVDKSAIISEYLTIRGLVKNQLESFNYFVQKKMKEIVANTEIRSEVDPRIYLRYRDVPILQPSIDVDGEAKNLNPQLCRLANHTYAAPIIVNIEYTTKLRVVAMAAVKDVLIGRMPILLGSCCCVLYGKDDEELAKLGECPLDPGGYFVIKGVEKVVLIEEKPAKNKIMIDTDKKGCVQTSVTSTDKTESRTVLKMVNERIYLELKQFRGKVPIMIVMRAMGMESDQEVVQMLGRDPRFSYLFLPSIKECADLKVYTRCQALDFLERVTISVEKGKRALGVLCDIFLPHVPVHHNNLRKKCIFVAVMLRRMMEAILNKDVLDDKCYTMGVEDLEQLLAEEVHTKSYYLIMLNGLILGKHRFPQKFADSMRKIRRAGKIGEFVSIFVNKKQGCVYIASDGGRLCRPLVIADNSVSKIKEHHMKELTVGVRDFDSFLTDGLIEYLDVSEENNSLIAPYEKDTTPETTHIEIDPILGVCAGLIPYPHHNQSALNTYQCAIGKKAMGNIAYNQLNRIDKLTTLLVYAQRPLLTRRTIELVGYDKLGAGQNATVAVMSFSGYYINSAIVMNKSSLDRGFGRSVVMKRYSAITQKYKIGTSGGIIRPKGDGPEVDGAEHMQILDDDGIASPGEIVGRGDICINKESFCCERAYMPKGLRYKGPEGERAVIDRVALYSDEYNNLCIKLMIRHTHRPEIGEKFSCRHGHKGVWPHSTAGRFSIF